MQSPTLEVLFNEIKTQRRKESSTLSEKDAQIALSVLEHPGGFGENDVFLVLASANFLNAFVKQSQDPEWSKKYVFKAHLSRYLGLCLKQKLDFMKFEHYKDVLCVTLNPFEFSFHHLDLEPSALLSIVPSHEDPWDGYRLQPYAKEIFDAARALGNPDLLVLAQLKALSDPIRFKILEGLGEEERCACTILEDFKVSQPTLSHHLAVLTSCGLIEYRKEGIRNLYQINHTAFESMIQRLKLLDKHID